MSLYILTNEVTCIIHTKNASFIGLHIKCLLSRRYSVFIPGSKHYYTRGQHK